MNGNFHPRGVEPRKYKKIVIISIHAGGRDQATEKKFPSIFIMKLDYDRVQNRKVQYNRVE